MGASAWILQAFKKGGGFAIDLKTLARKRYWVRVQSLRVPIHADTPKLLLEQHDPYRIIVKPVAISVTVGQPFLLTVRKEAHKPSEPLELLRLQVESIHESVSVGKVTYRLGVELAKPVQRVGVVSLVQPVSRVRPIIPFRKAA